jgi:hypothetical protein
MSLDICVADEVHLFVVVALLNIALYLVPCVKFDSFWYKACLAVDLGVLLKTIVETAIGPQDGHWPQDAGTNLFIALCFSLFFYVMAPNIWGTIFLVVGLLSVQSFWDGMYSQLQSFMQHSLDIIIDQTHTKWVTAVLILLVVAVLGVTLVFQLPTVKLVAMGVTTAFKLVISFKVLYIVIGKSEQICCSPDSDPDNCPLWISKVLWIIAVFLATIRIAAARHFLDYGWCDRKVKAGYKLVPEAEDSRDETEGREEEEKRSSKPTQDSSDDEQPTNKVNSKRNTLKSIKIGRPPRFTFTRRSASLK